MNFFFLINILFFLTQGFYLGKVLDTFGKYNFFNDPAFKNKALSYTRESLFSDGMVFFYVMLGIAFGCFIFAFVQFYLFSKVSIRFVLKVRRLIFQKLLRKDVAYFDQPENKPGQLSLRLSRDAGIIRTLVSNYMGAILQSLASFVIGVVFGFVYSWRMSLLVIALSPVIFLTGVLRGILYMGASSKDKKEDQNLVQECLNNIKVILLF